MHGAPSTAQRPSSARDAAPASEPPQPEDGPGAGRPRSAPLDNRELVSLRKAQQARVERTSVTGGGGGMPDPRGPAAVEEAVLKSPDCSTYHTAFNMRDDYPEMFAE